MATTFGVMLMPLEIPDAGRGVAWEQVCSQTRKASEAGARVVCAPDHLEYPAGFRNLECWTTLTALASVVPAVQVLPLVLSAPLRPPGVVAAMAATLDEITDGRGLVGLGAGVDEAEHVGAGARFGSPGERVAAVEATAVAVRERTGGRVPVVIAGGGPRMMRIVATHGDEWNCGMMEAHRRAELLDVLDHACEESGRAVRRSVLVTVLGGEPPDDDLARRYNWHLAFRGTTADQLVDEIGGLVAMGFDSVYFSALTPIAWQSTLGAMNALRNA